MKKYYISSDIHGFYDEYMTALKKAGFDFNNPEDILIICGDIFDRGHQPLEIYNFLKGLPKERRILIRGNHELLLKKLIERKYWKDYDIHNGTADTLCLIKYQKTLEEFYNEYYLEMTNSLSSEWASIKQERIELEEEMCEGKAKEIIDWIYSDEWVNYFETEGHIFVHSWIPVQEYIDFQKSFACGMLVKAKDATYREDWRNATQDEWNDAMWPCPWEQAKAGLNKTGKTIVCGHRYTSDFYNHLTKSLSKKDIKDNPIFKSKKYKLIGLDACTVLSGYINVLVLTEKEM